MEVQNNITRTTSNKFTFPDNDDVIISIISFLDSYSVSQFMKFVEEFKQIQKKIPYLHTISRLDLYSRQQHTDFQELRGSSNHDATCPFYGDD